MTQTIGSLLTHGENTLRTFNLPADDALVLLASALEREKEYILAHPDSVVNEKKIKRFFNYLDARSNGFSVAAITGYKEFFGLQFKVTKDTLIPRPDSELLISQALDYLEGFSKGSILDVGTGTGNLIISIAVHTNKKKFKYFACDISRKVLDVARYNARAHNVSIRFIQSNLLTHVPRKQFTCIVANLPYLDAKDLREWTIQREPVGALWGGTRGTELYSLLLEHIQPYFAAPGILLMEINPEQRNELTEQITKFLPHTSVQFFADLSGKDRVIGVTQ